MKFLTYEEMGKEVAERALDDFLVNDKTLREWINLMFEGMIPMSVIEDIKADVLDRSFSIVNPYNTYTYINVIDLDTLEKLIDKHIGKENE